MLRLTLVVSWKITSLVTGLDFVTTTAEIITECVRTARNRNADPIILLTLVPVPEFGTAD